MSQQPAKNGESSGTATSNTNPGNSKPGNSKPKSKKGKSKAGEKEKEKVVKTLTKDCAMLFGDSGPVIASGPSFGVGSKIGARLGNFVVSCTDPYFGVQWSIPRDPKQSLSEDNGFGVCHSYDKGLNQVWPSDHTITIKFPRGKISCSYDAVPLSVRGKFPKIENWDSFSYVTVKLNGGASPVIEGFGKRFVNPADAEIEGWVNYGKPIVEDATFLNVFHQRAFFFVVAWAPGPTSKNFGDQHLPPAFEYGYSPQPCDEKEMIALVDKNTGGELQACYNFDNDEDHLSAVNQSVIQDVLWVHREAEAIKEDKFSAYFVTPETGSPADAYTLLLVVPMTKEWRDFHEAAWRRLTKDNLFKVRIYEVITPKGEDYKPADWQCNIVEFPGGVSALDGHPVEEYDVVLRVDCLDDPEVVIRDFSNRSAANAALRESKRNHTRLFSQGCLPSNPKAWDIPTKDGRIVPPHKMSSAGRLALDHVKFRMEIHRALLRGSGFYSALVPQFPEATIEAVGAQIQDLNLYDKMQELPRTNFLNFEDKEYAKCIVEEALPDDRERFKAYLSDRPLDLGLIASPAGFGKTTAVAAATLAMQATFGPILCSAPTHVAVDNFASRLDQRTRAIAERYNSGKAPGDSSRLRHRFVLRAFSINDEERIFKHLLKKPEDVRGATQRGSFSRESRWKMNLSLVYWMLVLLRSPTVDQLDPDASPELHKIQQAWDQRDELRNLRDLVTGKMSWAEYSKTPNPEGTIDGMMKTVRDKADFLCSTPANAARGLLVFWKADIAKGLAVDEAGNMHRADLYGLWGNTLLPCLLAGDPRQLTPTVMTTNEEDAAGNPLNRFAEDGLLSPLAFFVATGIPVYRLKTQLRMADGMFDMISRIIYPDVPFKYGAGSQVSLPAHKIGRDVENFFRGKFSELSPAPSGKLLPIFVHCKGSRVFVDKRTMSKRSPDQVKIALDLLAQLVKATKIDPSRIVCIAPYKANIGLIDRMRKGRDYDVLEGMPPASTVDSFQGQEGDLAVVILGTAHPRPGPDFTCNAKRLNVMLSRQRSALLVVGDIHVATGDARYRIVDESTGGVSVVVGKALNGIYKEFRTTKRVVTVAVPGKEAAEGKGKGKDKAEDKAEEEVEEKVEGKGKEKA
ncbi:DNA helicase [Fusarium circinatum]|uniref:DNA helicase n=1 Tax=Fusarium circinatum TaxID=48490 RepID=A0A8H5WU05_FUSCI|nr:DNA helicase [Fusarium circinatum]